jgi:hypothetical protein
MADTKISAFIPATTVALVNIVPIVQSGANKSATLGQLKSLTNLPLMGVTTATAVSLSFDVVSISGACTVPAGTNGAKITLVSTDAGSVTGAGISFTFAAAGATISLIWLNAKWNVLSAFGMTQV